MLQLSYIIATRNRLPFLKITLQRLMDNLQHGEEIVVVDGDSGDGSKAYLQQLFEAGKIHQYLSEPDHNQAHGWNKALLMAKGEIIKKIIDDDVFCYNAIRECKDYMLAHPAIDVIISNDLHSGLSDYKSIKENSHLKQFKKWAIGDVPSFTFSDVHMLIRRSALTYIGLYNTSFTMMDWEYSLRISYLKTNVAYYSGFNALSVSHPDNVSSLKNTQQINEQGKRGEVFYEYAGDFAGMSNWSRVKIFLGSLLNSKQEDSKHNISADINDIYAHYYDHINELNSSQQATFVEKG